MKKAKNQTNSSRISKKSTEFQVKRKKLQLIRKEFLQKLCKTSAKHKLLLGTISLPIPKENEILLCEEDPSETKYEEMVSMDQKNNQGKMN